MQHNDSLVVSKRRMERLFAKMGEVCNETGQTLEIAIYGGSALMLDFDYRLASRDIDFVPVTGGAMAAHKIKEVADVALDRMGLADDLRSALRDDVEVFISDTPEYLPHGDYGGSSGRLRVFKASPRYILAMKALAMRSSLETQDSFDVWHLMDACKMKATKEVADLVSYFYPKKKVPARNRLIIDDLVDEKRAGRPYSDGIGWMVRKFA